MRLQDRTEVAAVIARFLAGKEEAGCPALAPTGPPERLPEHLPGGWVVYYQTRTCLETRDPLDAVVGHGPIVLLDDGRLLEGGSLDRDAADVLKRHAEVNR